jgi:hypothetical protein
MNSPYLGFLAVLLVGFFAFLFGLYTYKYEQNLRLHREQQILQCLQLYPGISVAKLREMTKVPKIYVHLFNLERNGQVLSDWKPGAYPRQRLYWVAKPTT